jgi:DNA-binding transcriptional LysR family regulator
LVLPIYSKDEALSNLLCEGVGFGILSREIAEPLIEKRKLIKLNQGRSMKDPLALAWYPRAEMPDYFKDVIEAILSRARKSDE